MSPIQKVDEYLEKTGVWYLATEDGDQPKVRPIGFRMLLDGKIYFGVGKHKDVYKQMVANPNVEIAATLEGSFLRYYGKAVFESDQELAEKAKQLAPFLQDIYNEKTGFELKIFHLSPAVAEFRNMVEVEESFSFE